MTGTLLGKCHMSNHYYQDMYYKCTRPVHPPTCGYKRNDNKSTQWLCSYIRSSGYRSNSNFNHSFRISSTRRATTQLVEGRLCGHVLGLLSPKPCVLHVYVSVHQCEEANFQDEKNKLNLHFLQSI